MTIQTKREGETLTIRPSERIDTVTAPDFQAAVDPLPEGITHVVLDFAGVDYISSAGLRVLLILQQDMEKEGVKLELKNVNDLIRDVFDVTGFLEILTLV